MTLQEMNPENINLIYILALLGMVWIIGEVWHSREKIEYSGRLTKDKLWHIRQRGYLNRW
jgi:hypothetical protein